ncbi:hypothetical protein [Allorhizobium borbori]|uniref:Uncharacterized protein n=1 Tax=Allorhizobium borbori TaxID=485907 RepID=A0A7W6K1Q2_9HYPH|nr:hypothetical protein [Allorhizobium borbori]MBB4103556.1 hypothetical protein [Allorhizobium borbori]
MTSFVDIAPGQWVLAFHQPYGPYDRTLAEIIAGYASHHWMDNRDKAEIFFVMQIQKVMPSTYQVFGSSRFIREDERLPRSHVIAGCKSEAAAIALRDMIFDTGFEAGERIEAEMHRRIKKFADRERARALKKIHRTLPHIFGGKA